MNEQNELDNALELNRKLIVMIEEAIEALQILKSSQQEVFDRIESLETFTKNEIAQMREDIKRLNVV